MSCSIHPSEWDDYRNGQTPPTVEPRPKDITITSVFELLW